MQLSVFLVQRPLEPSQARKSKRPATDGAGGAQLHESPMRAELFSVSQLERHARTIAGWHELAAGPGHDDWLLARLGDNEVALRDAYTLVTDAVQRGRQITPAAEWFIDNYHLIEEQIRTARRHQKVGNTQNPRDRTKYCEQDQPGRIHSCLFC